MEESLVNSKSGITMGPLLSSKARGFPAPETLLRSQTKEVTTETSIFGHLTIYCVIFLLWFVS